MTIGILCMATGIYERLFEGFYASMEQFFSPQIPKTYYIFTDSERLLRLEYSNVRFIPMENRGWVVNVLRRSELFLSVEEQLEAHDYLLNLNSNYCPIATIESEEVLPSAKSERLSALSFHVYRDRSADTYTYERNPESRAYVPYGTGAHYFQGGWYGGKTKAFLALSRWIAQATEEDMARGIVARFHDESYLNRYLLDRCPHLVSTDLACPEEWERPVGCKALLLDKNRVFSPEELQRTKTLYTDPTLSFLLDDTYWVRPIGLVRLRGGLGNQMFQYALLLRLAEQFSDRQFYLDIHTLPELECHQGYQLDMLFGVPDALLADKVLLDHIARVPQQEVRYIGESAYSRYEPIADSTHPIWVVDGYWQSERYFGAFDRLRAALTFDLMLLNPQSTELLAQIRAHDSVAIHVRRGDYVRSMVTYQALGGICNMAYYHSALARFAENLPCFVFSDDPAWARAHFSGDRFTVVAHNQGPDCWQDMALMAHCTHQIIANSSFSWWAAWLNTNPSKTICAPDRWYRQQPSYDILPKGWYPVSQTASARTYEDLTIVIPARIESPDRQRNLEAVLENLAQYDGLRVVVLEADESPKLPPTLRAEVVFVVDRNPLFHRTKYINQLCGLCTTPYVGVWDTDVVVPHHQFYEALALLRHHEANMVYPYDGRFHNVHGSVLDSYFQRPDEAPLFAFAEQTTLVWGCHSCGGAFMVNRAAYMEAGGENEAFRGWGPEDLERFKRWEIKGYRVARVDGPIFHLDHARGPNSRYFDLELMRSTMQVLLATCRTKPQ